MYKIVHIIWRLAFGVWRLAFGVWRLAYSYVLIFLLHITRKIKKAFGFALKNYSSHYRYLLGFAVEDTVICNTSQIKYLIHSTNNIIYYDNGDVCAYFRECRQHRNEKDYLRCLAREYFSSVINDSVHNSEFESILMKKLENDDSRRKFFGMGMAWGLEYPASRSRWAKYAKTHDASVIGLEDVPEWFSDLLPGFVRFSRWPVYDFCFNESLRPHQYHSYFSGKMKATYIIAVLCGASRIVPETKYVCLKIDGAVKMGVSTYPSSGINPDSMKNICITPGFQRDLLIMNMLDIICRQQDHRPNNYFCILDEAGHICGLSVFDNDAPNTFAPNPSVRFSSFNNEAAFVDSEGRINRPFLDKDATECLLGLSEAKISEELRGHLSGIEIFMLNIRVRRLKHAVRKSLHDCTLKLLRPEEFSYETVMEELSGKWGKTYMKFFVDKYGAKIIG